MYFWKMASNPLLFSTVCFYLVKNKNETIAKDKLRILSCNPKFRKVVHTFQLFKLVSTSFSVFWKVVIFCFRRAREESRAKALQLQAEGSVIESWKILAQAATIEYKHIKDFICASIFFFSMNPFIFVIFLVDKIRLYSYILSACFNIDSLKPADLHRKESKVYCSCLRGRCTDCLHVTTWTCWICWYWRLWFTCLWL